MHPCLLDSEVFTCCQCGKQFDHTQGTWLPIGIEDKRNPFSVVAGSVNNPPMVIGVDLRPPEIITSDDFTCYDCTH